MTIGTNIFNMSFLKINIRKKKLKKNDAYLNF